jgi:pimeloyl-ACP methyl ester carboxylesterase
LPAVLLHGVTDSWRSFEQVLERLPPVFHAFAISQRGHGESDRPETGYSYRDMSDDLRGFLDAMSIERTAIVGHSMGSLVAQQFAADYPKRVRGIALIGAFSTLYQDPGIAEFVANGIDPLTDPIDAGFAREWQLSTTARPIDPQFLEAVVRETLKVPARVWRATFHGFLETPDFTHELRGITVPAALFWGERDSYAARFHQDALLAAIPAARLRVYEGAGHALHWEDPDGFTSDLTEFLAGL